MINHLFARWKSMWHPDRYHGWGRKKSYFEGWYFKLVTADNRLAMAVIPGISMDDSGRRHAFIQVIDGTNAVSSYEEFDFGEFDSKKDRFAVRIGDNYFSAASITLDLPSLRGEISMTQHTAWPKSLGAPGIMGWYSFVPMMQCYHGVVSMHHHLYGHLTHNNQYHTLDGGIGYIEKDWGTSFPKSWIWIHSNHFEEADRKISLLASLAHIPWMGSYFVGFLVGFYLDDILYQFTSYNGSTITTSLDEMGVSMRLTKASQILELRATKAKTATLVSPISGAMRGKVNESLAATVSIKLKEGGRLIYAGTGRHTGLEIAGEVEILLQK